MVHLAKSSLVSQYDLSSVRIVRCGAAPLSRDTELQFKQVFNTGNIRQGIIVKWQDPILFENLAVSGNKHFSAFFNSP